MLILCVIDSLGSGGAQRQIINLAIKFKNKGHQVSFLTYHPSSFFSDLLTNAEIEISCINERRFIPRLLQIRKHIRHLAPDVVLSFLDIPNLLCELASFPNRKWKLIVSERSAKPMILSSIKMRTLRYFHLFADKIVCNSYKNAILINKVTNKILKDKIEIIYNSINYSEWNNSFAYSPRKDGKFHLLISASHQYLKNAKGLIEAINLLHDNYKSQLKVSWYGEQEAENLVKPFQEATSLIKYYNLEEVIKFYKATNLLPQFMKEADAVGLFSFYEGLPNSICEAMASGKPVIATSISDLPLIIEEGVNGFLTETCEPDSIKCALEKLLNCSLEDLLRMGKNGKDKAELLFCEENTTTRFIKLFESSL